MDPKTRMKRQIGGKTEISGNKQVYIFQVIAFLRKPRSSICSSCNYTVMLPKKESRQPSTLFDISNICLYKIPPYYQCFSSSLPGPAATVTGILKSLNRLNALKEDFNRKF